MKSLYCLKNKLLVRIITGGNMERKDELIKMVSDFSDDCLDEEFKKLNVNLVEKLSRKREVPFKRGKLEIWASGIVYAIGQLNFLFDDSFEPYSTPDEICNYFGAKKSSASNKARDIRKMLNLKIGDEEFSTQRILKSNVRSGDLTQVKSLRGAESRQSLRDIADLISLMSRH